MLACPSTGNLANAVAAAAARAGWKSVVLIPSSLERAKILTTAVYNGALIAVDGTLRSSIDSGSDFWVELEFVVREGPQFEAELINRTTSNLSVCHLVGASGMEKK